MAMETPEARNDELRRILWALQDQKKALDSLMEHGREAKINAVRYASLAMAADGLQNAISFTRKTLELSESGV